MWGVSKLDLYFFFFFFTETDASRVALLVN